VRAHRPALPPAQHAAVSVPLPLSREDQARADLYALLSRLLLALARAAPAQTFAAGPTDADIDRLLKASRAESLLAGVVPQMGAVQQQEFDKHFVSIRQDAAQYLVEQKVMTVGVDYLSIGGYEKDGVETHQIMLGAGMWVIEGLNLADIKPGYYELICLPLKIEGADGAPCRVVLR